MPTTYKNADGSFTTVPDGGGRPIRTPVAPTGATAVPINEGLSALMGNRILSKQPVVAPLGDKPLPPPDDKFLVPREDGKFDQVILKEDGYGTGLVGPETAIKMRDEGGYRVINPSAFQDEPEQLRDRIATALNRNPGDMSTEPTVGVPMRDGSVKQVPASKVQEAMADPAAAPVTTVPSSNETWRQPPSDFPGFGGDPARMVLNAQGQWAHPELPTGAPRPPTPDEQRRVDESFAKRALDEKVAANPLSSFFEQPAAPGAAGQQPASTTVVAKQSSSGPAFVAKKTDVGMKELEEAQAMKVQALGAAQAFEEGQAERRRLAMETAQAQDERLLAEQQELERLKQERVGEATQKYVSMLEESQKPGGQLDPGRWWGSRSTGQKVAAVLGQALAAFGAGMQGRAPVDMIGKFVEDDLALQQAQLARDDAKQRQNLESQGKILALTEKQYGDPIQAKAAARAMVWENMDRQLALGEARAGTEAAKAKYAGLRAQVAEEAAKAKSDLVFRTEQLHLAQSANAREWKALQIQQQAAQAKTGAGALTPKELQDQVENLGKDMQPLVRASGAIEQIDSVLRGVGKDGDVPGTGMVDSRALGPLDSKQDIEVRQAKEQLGGIIGNILSGAGMSDTEREQRLGAYGLAKGNTEAEFRAGYPQARAFIQNQVDTVRAKYHPLAVDTFGQRLRAQQPYTSTPKQ